jgi:Rad3-related DNA helicase
MSLLPSSLGLSGFPGYRPGQEDLIWQLAASPNRFSGLNAPPGTGKSLISMSVARVLGGRCLYLVVTKNLGRQLLASFESSGLYNINGHLNYPCATSFTTEDELEIECQWGDQCDYQAAVAESLRHDAVTTNYAHHVSIGKSEDSMRLGEFDTLVLDEAHNVLPKLSEYLSITFSERAMSRYVGVSLPPMSANLSACLTWAQEVIPICRDRYKSLTASKADPRDIRRVKRIGIDLARFIKDADRADWLLKPRNPQLQYQSLTFLPLDISSYTEQYLFRGIKRVLLVSGTLFEDDLKPLGITDSYDYTEVPSPFQAAHRPIYFFPSTPAIRVNDQMSKSERTVWQRHVDKICEYELALGNRGIVHTRSYKRAVDMISQSRLEEYLVITHESGSQHTSNAIDMFKSYHRPIALFSPSLEEGVDFPYDSCRFQIIPKIPFLYHRDVVTAARIARDKSYADRETCRTMIQEMGRIVRAPDDWGRTYVTDSHWEWFRKKKYFYRWLRLAYKTARQMSEIKAITIKESK